MSTTRKRRQTPVEARGQVPLDVTKLHRNDVEIVEQPFGTRLDELAATDVVSEAAVSALEKACVVEEAGRQVAAARSAAVRHHHGARQLDGAALQSLADR
jgi:hypothetical protein